MAKKKPLAVRKQAKKIGQKLLFKENPPRVKKVKPEKPKDTDPKEASKWRYGQLRSLGIEVEWVEAWKAIKAIKLLRKREATVEAVAVECQIEKWERVYPSRGQLGLLYVKGVDQHKVSMCRCIRDAGLLLTALLEPEKAKKLTLAELAKCQSNDEVTAVGKDVAFVRGVLPRDVFDELVAAGIERRQWVTGKGIPA